MIKVIETTASFCYSSAAQSGAAHRENSSIKQKNNTKTSCARFCLQFSLCFICWWMCSIIKSLKKFSWMCNVNLINGKNSMSKPRPRAQCMLHCMPLCSATRRCCLLISCMYCSSQILTDLIWWWREEHRAHIQCTLKMYYHMKYYKKKGA